MLKLNLNESNYIEVVKKIENKQDIETTFRTYTTLDTSNKRYSVYSIYAEYRDVATFGSHNYQWVLAGYTDNGVLYLTADEIRDYNLSSYMNGEVITNLEGMIKDYPEAFYIEDTVMETCNNNVMKEWTQANYVKNIRDNPKKYCTEVANYILENGLAPDSVYYSKLSDGNYSVLVQHIKDKTLAEKIKQDVLTHFQDDNVIIKSSMLYDGETVRFVVKSYDAAVDTQPPIDSNNEKTSERNLLTKTATKNDAYYIKIGKAVANYYDEISFNMNGIIIYTNNKKALYTEITNALKSIENTK